MESICPKLGQPMKTYCLLQKRPRKALKYGRFRGLIFHASASLFPHVVSLLQPQSSPSTAGGAIPRPPIREKGPAAYRAGPGFRGGAFRSEGRLQHGIIGQHRLPEVAAQRPRPALLQHKSVCSRKRGYGRYGGSRVSALMYSVMECHLLRGNWGYNES